MFLKQQVNHRRVNGDNSLRRMHSLPLGETVVNQHGICFSNAPGLRFIGAQVYDFVKQALYSPKAQFEYRSPSCLVKSTRRTPRFNPW